MREIVRFETNIPQVIALAFDTGKIVEGRYGDQVQYTLEDDRLTYVPPIVERKIQDLGIRKGEKFQLCKRETKDGNRRSIEWQVEKIGTAQPASSQAAKPKEEAAAAETPAGVQSQSNTNGAGLNGNGSRPATKLEDALKTVIAAVHASRIFAKEIGFEMPVFTAEDLRTMANTLMIEGRNGGLR